MVWEGHRQLKRDIKTIITCTSKSAEHICQDNWMVYSMYSMLYLRKFFVSKFDNYLVNKIYTGKYILLFLIYEYKK